MLVFHVHVPPSQVPSLKYNSVVASAQVEGGRLLQALAFMAHDTAGGAASEELAASRDASLARPSVPASSLVDTSIAASRVIPASELGSTVLPQWHSGTQSRDESGSHHGQLRHRGQDGTTLHGRRPGLC